MAGGNQPFHVLQARFQTLSVIVDDEPLEVGDWVLLHVGFAMSRIDEAEAAETLAFLRELGSVYDEEIEAFSTEQP